MESAKNKRYRYIASALYALYALYEAYCFIQNLHLRLYWRDIVWEIVWESPYFLLAFSAALMGASLLFRRDDLFTVGCVLGCIGQGIWALHFGTVALSKWERRYYWEQRYYTEFLLDFQVFLISMMRNVAGALLSISLVIAVKKKSRAKKLCWICAAIWLALEIACHYYFKHSYSLYCASNVIWAAAIIMTGYVFSSDPLEKYESFLLKETTVSGKIQKIEKLKALRDCGAITQEDFEAKKKEILEGTL